MMEIIVKIMVEMLAILAQAKKQVKQGRFSKCSLTLSIARGHYHITRYRAICKETVGRQRDRKNHAEIGPTHPGRDPHDGGAHLGGGLRPYEQYESGHGW